MDNSSIINDIRRKLDELENEVNATNPYLTIVFDIIYDIKQICNKWNYQKEE